MTKLNKISEYTVHYLSLYIRKLPPAARKKFDTAFDLHYICRGYCCLSNFAKNSNRDAGIIFTADIPVKRK